MNDQKFIAKNKYTTKEVIDYCNSREINLLKNNTIDYGIIDELYLLEKLKTTYLGKKIYYDDIDVLSIDNTIKLILNSKSNNKNFEFKNYIDEYKKYLKYLIKRFNIYSSEKYDEKSNFDIYNNNGEKLLNIRRYFYPPQNIPKHFYEFNNNISDFFKYAKINYNVNNKDDINRNICRINSYYYNYSISGLYGFSDYYFIWNLENYSEKFKNYSLNYSSNFKLLINRLPINFFDQENIKIYFRTKKDNIIIKNIHFYHDFAYCVYGRENDNVHYRKVTKNNYNKLNEFLLVANTSTGTVIYETGKEIKYIKDKIIYSSKNIDLEKNIIFLINKKSFFITKYHNYFFSKNTKLYSRYYLDSSVLIDNKDINISDGIIDDEKVDGKCEYFNDKKYYIFYLSDDDNINGRILREILKDVTYEIIENYFYDDTSINYKIYISEDNIQYLSLLYYMKFRLNSLKIYGVSLEDFLHFLLKDYEFYKDVIKNPVTKEPREKYLLQLEKVYAIVKEHLKEENISEEEFINILYNNYVKKDIVAKFSVDEYFYYGDNKNQLVVFSSNGYKKPQIYENYKLKASEEYKKIKWKSEYKLYKMIKKKYEDAIYQYRASWLGQQSIDIYIPEIKIAIEYQGQEHYKEIDFFSGSLSERQNLDEKKKEKCKENNVTLIEWKYDEPISEIELEQKLGNLHITSLELNSNVFKDIQKSKNIKAYENNDRSVKILEIEKLGEKYIKNIERFSKLINDNIKYVDPYIREMYELYESENKRMQISINKTTKELQNKKKYMINLEIDAMNRKLKEQADNYKHLKELIVQRKKKKENSNASKQKKINESNKKKGLIEKIISRIFN